MKDSVKDESELQKALEEEQNKNAELETKYKDLQLNSAILAVNHEANDADDILTFINKDELELADDGTVKGLDEAIGTLKSLKLIYLRRLSL